MAHKTFTEFISATSRNDLHFLSRSPSRFCPFLLNRSPPGSFWSSSRPFSFWCPSHCYVAVVVLVLSQYVANHLHLPCFTSSIVGFMCALSSNSSVVVLPLDFIGFFVGTCYEIHPLICRLPCSFSIFPTCTAGLAATSVLYSLRFVLVTGSFLSA